MTLGVSMQSFTTCMKQGRMFSVDRIQVDPVWKDADERTETLIIAPIARCE